ncbi:helicase HerA domain-containing protein [Halopenitus salinus]|uniref:Helicase HerA domain-containing protein n=1 Tax=Halopenitus salinus TaxID=1198295 RepID=A0ABD5V0E1_9EURY
MSEEDTETIHVAEVSDGRGGDADADPGDPVELPVVDVLTGRSFITGKSGSGKSNTASVLIENLLDNSFPVLIVDSDGEYYGLKEEYEILHVGADDECDIVVSPEHAERIATLALDENVPIILDVSGYLEESVASELILNVVKHLFAKEKKLKRPFLLVIEECHEYIPEGGGMDETGKMLIKVGKRGRKHGLGIVGISQRPADVKKDFITQCDWLVWHRLTWDNDTNVVSRILGSTYADEIEDMGDGEAFLMTDWDESIRRIQFHRKRTFDAGATPGLDDFERPELKSVSGDLISELETISDEQERRESELADLRTELERKQARIDELERELSDAKDLSRMAERFSQALLGRAEAPYRGGDGRNLERERPDDQSELHDYEPEREPGRNGTGSDEPSGELDETNDRLDETDGLGEGEAGGTAEPGETDESSDSAESAEPAEPSDAAGTVSPISRDDVAESALRFDETVDLGTREAVIAELRGRVEDLPELSTAMLCHYRREGESDPIAAHIDAGGDGDTEHAYARNRPLRRTGVIRHAERGRYEYAIPALVREAYADRLDDEEVSRMVAEIEAAFVPAGERESEDENPDTDGDADAGDGSESEYVSDSEPVSEPESVIEEMLDQAAESNGDVAGSVHSDDRSVSEIASGLSEVARALANGGHLSSRSGTPEETGTSTAPVDAEGTDAADADESTSTDGDGEPKDDAHDPLDPAADDAEFIDADG